MRMRDGAAEFVTGCMLHASFSRHCAVNRTAPGTHYVRTWTMSGLGAK
jgi:hypothetical protein